MIFICILTFILFLFNYIFNNKILNPTNLFILYWLMQFLIVTLLIPKEINRCYIGYIYIISICVVMTISNIIVKSIYRGRCENLNNKEKIIRFKNLKKVTIITICLGLTYSLIKLKQSGFRVNNVMNLSQLAKITNSISVERYTGNSSSGIVGQLMLSFVYLAPFLGALILATKPFKKYKLYAIATLIPAVITILIQSTRSIILSVACIFISVYWTFKIYMEGDRFKPINIKSIIGIILGGVILIYFFSFLQMLRGGKITDSLIDNDMITRIKIYFAAHLPAFSYWIEHNLIYNNVSLGSCTFSSIFNLLGIKSVQSGIFSDYVYLFGNSGTNIYTYFRCLIEDFGIAFTYLIFFIMGILSNIAYYKTKEGIFMWIIILIPFYIMILFYPVSFFAYNTHILGLVIFTTYIFFSKYKISRSYNEF